MKLLSRYRPRYVRSLIYMLQACEYNISDYLAWYHRTSDFARVEKRKRLVYTPKALALTAISWGFIILLAAGLMSYGAYTGSNVPPVVLYGIVLIMPFYFPYVLAFIALFLRFLQMPIEDYIVWRAKNALAGHKGIRVAVAGSFGKTSMREILKTVLAEGKKVAAPPGSYNTPLGVCSFVMSLEGDEDILIFELGEYYPGDIRKLCKLVKPQIGIITGVNEAHLEKFKTIERAAATIFELAEYLPKGPVYVNGENELAKSVAPRGSIFYTREGAGRWSIKNAISDLDGITFTLESGSEEIGAQSRVLGLHMLGPLAAAADIASRTGLTVSHIAFGIGKTRPFKHRLRKRVDEAGVITLDDSYNGNPDGAAAAIDFLASLKGARRFYITPGLVEMGSRKEAVHKEIGRRIALAGVEKVVLIRNSVTPYIEEGLKESGYKNEIIWFDDALEAYKALPHMTAKGDVVLLQNDWPDQYA